MIVEVQRTARFCIFIAPGTSSKVDWAAVLPSTKNLPLESPAADNSRSTMASDGSVAAAVSVGARKVLPEDVILVAVHGARVDLNQAALDKACPTPGQAGYKVYSTRFDGNHTAAPLSHIVDFRVQDTDITKTICLQMMLLVMGRVRESN